MIDPETRQKLETNLAVKLAVIPAARFRALAKSCNDAARATLARELAEDLAHSFHITPDDTPREAPDTGRFMRG